MPYWPNTKEIHAFATGASDVQDRFRYVPTSAMRSIAEYFDIPESRSLRWPRSMLIKFDPKGRKDHKGLPGTVCHLRGGKQILKTISENLE